MKPRYFAIFIIFVMASWVWSKEQSGAAEAHVNRGIALAAKGSLDDAIAEFRFAIHLNPSDPSAHYYLGNAFYAQGELNKAIAPPS